MLCLRPGDAPYLPLGEVTQPGGKLVVAFAYQGDADLAALRSNDFEMEWPPRSGRLQAFPEVDRYGFFDLTAARGKIHPAQATFLDRLRVALPLQEE